MKKIQIPPSVLTELRRKAKVILEQEVDAIDTLSRDQLRNMVHGLCTQQIELELQNEELHQSCEDKVQQRTRQLAKANTNLQNEIVERERASRKLEDYIQRQDVLNALLQISIEDRSLEELLKCCIDNIIAFPELGLKPSGIIFLKENASQNLVMKAHANIPEDLLRVCSSRPVGECLCGRAASTGMVLFALWQEDCHEVIYRDIYPHGHYCVPIMTAGYNVLGVLTLFTEVGTSRDMAVEETLVASSNVIAGIIERTQAKSALYKKTELLSSIYTAANSVALVTTDLGEENTRITSFSPGAEQMFGYAQDEAVGQPISLLNISEHDRSTLVVIRRLQAGRKLYFPDTVLLRKSGQRFAATVAIHPLFNSRGNIIGTLGVCIDISNLKMVQAELQQANEELEKRVEQRTIELQRTQQQVLHVEKLGAIGRLSASIAHEFNNPMQGIVTVLNGIAKRVPLEDEDMALARSAIDECKRIKSLIRNLQDFNRPTSGKKELMNLRKAIDTLLLLCKKDCNHRNITVITEYGEDTPYVMAISDQIKQVILNLLSNASDACPNGGTIYISTRPKGNAALVQIRDTGIGITPENLDRIYEPFFTTKPEVKGTGLGLSVSYGIIKQHNGRLDVESEPGKGTTFTITLPIKGC